MLDRKEPGILFLKGGRADWAGKGTKASKDRSRPKKQNRKDEIMNLKSLRGTEEIKKDRKRGGSRAGERESEGGVGGSLA